MMVLERELGTQDNDEIETVGTDLMMATAEETVVGLPTRVAMIRVMTPILMVMYLWWMVIAYQYCHHLLMR